MLLSDDRTGCARAMDVSRRVAGLNGAIVVPGYPCGIYTSSLKCTDYMVNSLRPRLLADYVPWWIADYRGFNGFAQTYPEKLCAGWQYSAHEWIGGMEVDMNEWYL